MLPPKSKYHRQEIDDTLIEILNYHLIFTIFTQSQLYHSSIISIKCLQITKSHPYQILKHSLIVTLRTLLRQFLKYYQKLLSILFHLMGATQTVIYVLAIIGAIWVAYILFSFIWTIIKLIIPRADLAQEYGANTWALITGASDGIGLSFAKELAREGFNICLVARNFKKLSAVESEIKQLYPDVQTKIVIADFVQSQTPGFFENIEKEVSLLDISILVNNVGIMISGRFQQLSVERLIQQINVNCLPPCCLTNLLLPGMLKRDNRSAIINISSTAATVPTPYTSNYSGTKAYGTMLSRGLQLQFKDKIDTLCVQPNWVQSNLSKLSTSRFDVVTSDECAKASLDNLGYTNVTMGHWKHRVYGWVIRNSPSFVVNVLSRRFAIRTHEERKMPV